MHRPVPDSPSCRFVSQNDQPIDAKDCTPDFAVPRALPTRFRRTDPSPTNVKSESGPMSSRNADILLQRFAQRVRAAHFHKLLLPIARRRINIKPARLSQAFICLLRHPAWSILYEDKHRDSSLILLLRPCQNNRPDATHPIVVARQKFTLYRHCHFRPRWHGHRPLRGWGPGRNQEGPPGPNGIDVPEWSCDTTT